ncbi:peptidase T [Anaerococcus sp. NML200574]|uniref:peptidase T n=1 Tax=Anaerococcus sp. NML200574 TaxID=2954486 RepID=UPI00223745CA|nr:peptidase T [Anaerococcus sp. NML200574]MCW6677621.1 peptidase T [Anaerococcus sp. NML200574]
MNEKIIKDKLVENFLKYLAIPSQSDDKNEEVPSSPGQWEMAKVLAADLEDVGLVDIKVNDFGVVQARLPRRGDRSRSIGWVAHLDTVDVGLSDKIHPQLIKAYDGKDIKLNEEITFYVKDNPEILDYIGDDIILTDGTSVLGADNKAAIANIMTALWFLKENPEIDHCEIFIAFVPDEEIGLRGSRKIDFDKFNVDYAYTIDCCALGELVYETFNAASGTLKIKGVSAHPMSAKDNLVNPIMIAHDFISMLDRAKMPENTENREGYIWMTDIKSDVLNLRLDFNIRNHDREKFEASKAYLYKIADLLKERYKKAQIEIEISDVYDNIADSMNDENKIAVERLREVFKSLEIEEKIIPMRGGTDGSFLSRKGIFTPNYFTGAHNFHSNKEFLPIDSFYKSFLVTLNLMQDDF